MKTLRCLFVMSFILSSLGFVPSAWSGEASLSILGVRGLVMPSGIITKFEVSKFTIKDETGKLFVIAEIARRHPLDKAALLQFKIGKRVKIEDGKISTLPDPLPRPIQEKGALPDPMPRPATVK